MALWPKFEILTVLGAVFSHFCPGNSEIWHGPLPHAKFHVYRGNVSILWGEKPIFWLLSKNNTSVVALGAGLPVIKALRVTAKPNRASVIAVIPISRKRLNGSRINFGRWSNIMSHTSPLKGDTAGRWPHYGVRVLYNDVSVARPILIGWWYDAVQM